MRTLALLSVLVLSACNTTNNPPDPRAVETNLSPVKSITVELAEKRGAELFAKDTYAAKATDLLLQKDLLNASSGVLGWITEIKNDRPITYFIGGTSNEYKIVFEVQYKDGETPELVKSSAISKELSDKFTVRELSLQSIQAPCSRNYNTIVIENSDDYIVYALASTTENNKIVVGGHYRFTYSKVNSSLISKERLSNSCLVLNNSEGSIPFATHILTETPLEIHAYLGKLHGEFYVSTKSGLYKAKNGKLELLKK
ncbi:MULTISPECIES: hypothetical protein [unclassified Pseudoalteromonas]|uniref:hypothetical protein n=1 Tax=unclassified Pseudoalteromonas TaxID=194690 RepID=UPI00117B73D4|nr:MULTISPECIES: hypothetical protein [unclassified Pseudoalteromonas]MDP2634632.1 hypothetical protein [Pseudoalteromonas sp. 1_MG-2023]